MAVRRNMFWEKLVAPTDKMTRDGIPFANKTNGNADVLNVRAALTSMEKSNIIAVINFKSFDAHEEK